MSSPETQTQFETQIQNMISEVLEKFDLELANKLFNMLKTMPLDKELHFQYGEEREVQHKRFDGDRVLCRYYYGVGCRESLGMADPALNTWNTVRVIRRRDHYDVELLSYDRLWDTENIRATFSTIRVSDVLDVLCNLLFARFVSDP